MGRVSRAPHELFAARNCTRDEGGPFEFGDQEPISSHRKLLWVKSHGGERCGNAGTMISAGTVERGERKRTVSEVRWLGISDLIAEPEGPSFISRTVPHRRLDR